MRFPLIPLCVLSFLCLTTVVAAVSWSRRGCPERCGNVTIPYPFGIGAECSMNSSYTVTCLNSSIPILSSINLEAVNISIESGIVTVKHPVAPLVCSLKPKTQSLLKSLWGSPFTISEIDNNLVVLGCQNVVWLRANETTTVGGCMALCDASSTQNSCSGVNCCQTSIPENLQELEFTYQSIDESGINGSTHCGYVFLADQKWFQEDYKAHKNLQRNFLNPFDEEFRYAALVLDWRLKNTVLSSLALPGCSRERRRRNHLSFPDDNYYYSGYYYRPPTSCTCRYGFEGNPYLPEGCQDIDECSNSTLNRCEHGTCINEYGYYSCHHPDDNSSQVIKIVLISVGSGLGALLMLFVAWRSSKVLWKKFKAHRKKQFFKRNGGLLLEQHELSSTEKGVQKTKLFSSKELAKATDRYNENRVLGRGGQGTVYKGMLTDGRIVAVKKAKKIGEGDIEIFINEVVILSQINHRNVVKLLGCCLETEIPLLVYEFIPNGTLFQHIHEPNEEFPLTWDMRVRIATEIANSLSYLHSAASAPIYHRDIKSTNILLDDKYRAKISDFGTSRSVAIDQTHLTTRVLGTFGYLDPEYFQSSQFTDKSDVYSFGVVMVELLTGEKAVSSIRSVEAGRSLATHFLYSMDENRLFSILNDLVLKEGRREEIVAFAEIARRCLHLNGRRRPTMKEVAVELEGIRISIEKNISQQNVEDVEYHSIKISESWDFSTISGSTHLDTITLTSSDFHPLLTEEY